MENREYIVDFLNGEVEFYDYEKYEGLQDSSKEKINDYLGRSIGSKLSLLLDGLEGCESPIEEKLLLSSRMLEGDIEKCFQGNHSVVINTQVPINLEGKTIRPDIQIGYQNHSEDWYQFLLVECDGHEFHEKTKEQAKKDKSRDRLLMANGYHVMRFTGSEIHKDSDACAKEIFKFIKYDLENRIKKKR